MPVHSPQFFYTVPAFRPSFHFDGKSIVLAGSSWFKTTKEKKMEKDLDLAWIMVFASFFAGVTPGLTSISTFD